MACHQSKNQVAKLRFLWPYELALSAGFELGNHRVEDHRLTPPLSLGLHQHVAHCPRSLTATPHDLSSGSRIQPQDQLGGGGEGFGHPRTLLNIAGWLAFARWGKLFLTTMFNNILVAVYECKHLGNPEKVPHKCDEVPIPKIKKEHP